MNDFASDLELALRMADAADAISLDRFRAQDLKVESKPDSSPVTDADRADLRGINGFADMVDDSLRWTA